MSMPPAPAMPAVPRVLVVTGTDTGVGKTVVTAALAACLAGRGSVAVFKPAQTGVGPGEPGDVDEVARLVPTASVHEGLRVAEPLAPTTACRRAAITPPTVAQHAATVRDLADAHDTVLVEGAGGLLVGLDTHGAGLTELAAGLDVPHAFLVVTRPSLGTLNHTGLTVEALRRRHLPVGGLVIGEWPHTPDLAEQCNLQDLPGTSGVPVVGRLPEAASKLAPAEFAAAAPSWFSHPLGTA